MAEAIVIGGDYYYDETLRAENYVLGHFCFCNMKKLKKVILPRSLREFKRQDSSGTFWGNDSPFASPATLEEVVVNGGKIGECAFMKCTRLKSVTLGEGVTDITGGAFGDCCNITEVWNYGGTPMKISDILLPRPRKAALPAHVPWCVSGGLGGVLDGTPLNFTRRSGKCCKGTTLNE